MSEEREDIVILIDEDGNEVEAEHIDTIVYNNSEYVVLLPKDGHVCDDGCEHDHEHSHTRDHGEPSSVGNRETDNDSDGIDDDDSDEANDVNEDDAANGDDDEVVEEIIILKVSPGKDGEEPSLVSIDDEDEQDAVFDIFAERIADDEYEFEDEDDYEDNDDENP